MSKFSLNIYVLNSNIRVSILDIRVTRKTQILEIIESALHSIDTKHSHYAAQPFRVTTSSNINTIFDTVDQVISRDRSIVIRFEFGEVARNPCNYILTNENAPSFFQLLQTGQYDWIAFRINGYNYRGNLCSIFNYTLYSFQHLRSLTITNYVMTKEEAAYLSSFFVLKYLPSLSYLNLSSMCSPHLLYSVDCSLGDNVLILFSYSLLPRLVSLNLSCISSILS